MNKRGETKTALIRTGLCILLGFLATNLPTESTPDPLWARPKAVATTPTTMDNLPRCSPIDSEERDIPPGETELSLLRAGRFGAVTCGAAFRSEDIAKSFEVRVSGVDRRCIVAGTLSKNAPEPDALYDRLLALCQVR